MTELHPDRHTLKPTDEQERLNNEASKVSRAYDVLRNPHTRATHLLELLGRPMDETVSVSLPKLNAWAVNMCQSVCPSVSALVSVCWCASCD